MLNDWGFEFDTCSNGKFATEKLQEAVYSLILMDLQMPEMNGYEATVFIRTKLLLNTPIIAMTAQTLPEERDRCLRFGMNEYISKPIHEDDLLALINNILHPFAEE